MERARGLKCCWRAAWMLSGSMLAILAPQAAVADDVPLLADTYVSGSIPNLNFGSLADLRQVSENGTTNGIALITLQTAIIISQANDDQLKRRLQ